jgi:type IV pilus assembly protein PilM
MALFGKNTFLTVDIGTTSIKVGEFKRGLDKPELINYGILNSKAYLDGSGDAIQTSSFRMLEPVAQNFLKKLLKRMQTKTRNAVVSLPAFHSFSTLIDIPKMSKEETEKAIPYQSRQYIPAPISTVQIDWSPVGEKKDAEGNIMQQVFLVSTSNSIVEKYNRVFKSAGLQIKSYEPETVSLVRAITKGEPDPILIVDIGSRSTSISVGENGFLKFSAQTDFSGGSLTQVLATGLDITLNRAEDLKIQKGISATGGSEGLSTLMTPMLDAIINEAARAANSFEESYKKSVKRAVLSGGTGRLKGIRDYFSKNLGMPVELADPFGKISYPESLRSLTGELSTKLSVVIGLALDH